MNNLIIAPYESGIEYEINKLIRKVYDEFVAPDYSDEGNQHFYEWIKPENIAERQKENRNILVAKVNNKLAGMIEIRQNNRISLLFVDKQYQKHGIARQLFERSLKNSHINDPDLNRYFVHASPYSIPVYKKIGFIETGEMTIQNGISYLPMEIILSKYQPDESH
jgi:predicted GNAT family N-acyltransferase